MTMHFSRTLAWLPVAGLLWVAGCDSQSQLVANRTVAATTVAATESIQVVGSTSTISYQFAKSQLPAAIANGNNLAVVLGGRPIPVTASGPFIVANLPPTSPPLVPDSSGNAPILVQSNGGSAIVELHIGTILTPLPAPQATVSLK
ncbi:MAG: hypothetical protein KGR26_16475 [Cyanobacteria bacterium REEB65]|nr:hypothetical protein [Cyanobacteria bacterium REEB65]